MKVLEHGRWTNPKMLTWAREQVELTLGQAAEYAVQRRKRVAKTTFPASDLLAWERGVKDPRVEDLELLAEIYGCPAGYFFLETPPQQVTPRLNFRGLAPDKAQQLRYETYWGLRRFQSLAEYAERLTRQLGRAIQAQVVPATINEDVEEVVSRALESLGVTRERRASWTTAEEAFNWWRGAIERQGILVFSMKLDSRDLRGASIEHELGPPAILVNHADVEAATGRTFTLLHEYAHLGVKRSGLVCDFRGQQEGVGIETFANRFAAEAIVPSEEFRSLLHRLKLDQYRDRWSDPLLDELRDPFKASRDVVAILLQNLELAPPDFYQRKRKMWEKRRPFGRGGRGGGQPLVRRRLRELGPTFSKLLVEAESRGIISRLDVADLLDTNVEQANRFIASAQNA